MATQTLPDPGVEQRARGRIETARGCLMQALRDVAPDGRPTCEEHSHARHALTAAVSELDRAFVAVGGEQYE